MDMEQVIPRTNRRSGWSDTENKLLWESADEAQQQGLPLKNVFEQIAEQTGRRPNSIRNYYYAQVRQREGDEQRVARFVPFAQEEVDWLMEQVLTARAEGLSVRACLQKLAGGDHSLMLRYQNKYRAMIKTRPEYVRDMVERLNDRGVACDTPMVHHRARVDVQQQCAGMAEQARRYCDAELAHALETLADRLTGNVPAYAPNAQLVQAAQQLLLPIKEFSARDRQQRLQELDSFCNVLLQRVGELEACLPVTV